MSKWEGVGRKNAILQMKYSVNFYCTLNPISRIVMKTKSTQNLSDGSLKETAYLLSTKANVKRLMKGIRQANKVKPF
jgi:hypothetical protein